jgi:hypothetical protein
MIEFLHTYLFIPRPRKDLFVRPRFVDSLNIERESYMASDNLAFSGGG